MFGNSVFTPYYSETVLYSSTDLRSENEDGISTLFYLQKIFPGIFLIVFENFAPFPVHLHEDYNVVVHCSVLVWYKKGCFLTWPFVTKLFTLLTNSVNVYKTRTFWWSCKSCFRNLCHWLPIFVLFGYPWCSLLGYYALIGFVCLVGYSLFNYTPWFGMVLNPCSIEKKS